MPVKVRRFWFLNLLVILTAAATAVPAQSQSAAAPTQTQTAAPTAATPIRTPTTAEVMRDRLSKAKAFIAVHNYGAAVFELEGIRRETSDSSVNAVANVLLMNSYIEQGDYKRATDLLNDFYRSYKANNANGNLYYTAVAAQVVKSARNQVERYRGLGLTVSDRNLPLEAVNDIERMRELVEAVVAQTKELAADKVKGTGAMALMEEAVNSRAMLARDDYDARRWKAEAAEWREDLASSRSVVINATDGTAVPTETAQNTGATGQPSMGGPAVTPASMTQNQPASAPMMKPIPTQQTAVADPPKADPKPVGVPSNTGDPAAEPQRNRVVSQQPATQPAPSTVTNNDDAKTAAATAVSTADAAPAGPMNVGSSLIAYATKQQAPVYPAAARNMRATGVVRVDVTIDENGEVTEIQKTSGPQLLQTAAKDAIRKWKFRPFVRDGHPVKATGFVNFNFAL
jgi:protein TonB